MERYTLANSLKINTSIYLKELNYIADTDCGNILNINYITENDNNITVVFKGRIISYRKRIENAGLVDMEKALIVDKNNKIFQVENSSFIKQLDENSGGNLITVGYDPIHYFIIDNDDDIIDVVITSNSPIPEIIMEK